MGKVCKRLCEAYMRVQGGKVKKGVGKVCKGRQWCGQNVCKGVDNVCKGVVKVGN